MGKGEGGRAGGNFLPAPPPSRIKQYVLLVLLRLLLRYGPLNSCLLGRCSTRSGSSLGSCRGRFRLGAPTLGGATATATTATTATRQENNGEDQDDRHKK